MLCKAKFAVCSEIYAKYTNSIWLQCRIFECQILWYAKLPVGFKRLIRRKSQKVIDKTAGSLSTVVTSELQWLPMLVALARW